jgi:hypothetical protein
MGPAALLRASGVDVWNGPWVVNPLFPSALIRPAEVLLLSAVGALEDPRQSWRVVCPLPEVLLLLLCATLSGMEDFTEISPWGRERLAFLRRFLLFDRGAASHDALSDIVNAIDGETFKTCFSSWVETLKDAEPDIIASDGKTSRRAHARAKEVSSRHMVSARASRQRLVLGQEATAETSNEIRATPLCCSVSGSRAICKPSGAEAGCSLSGALGSGALGSGAAGSGAAGRFWRQV